MMIVNMTAVDLFRAGY